MTEWVNPMESFLGNPCSLRARLLSVCAGVEIADHYNCYDATHSNSLMFQTDVMTTVKNQKSDVSNNDTI